jgi:riboflavin biosynthesis pyrimidine reductase
MPESEAAGAAETPLTMLESGRALDEGELPHLYDYPADLDRAWVRANFITSVDGGATAEGTSGTLAGPGDRSIFNLLRELADVIVVGAGTVRVEGYSGAHMGVAKRHRRHARGQSEVPPLAIVTKSGRLDRDMGVFTRTEVPPLVLTCTAAANETRRLLGDLAEVVDCSGSDPGNVDEAALLAILTIAPYLVGGMARRIATGPGQLLTQMRCAHVLTDDAGYLYTRYVKGAR